MIQYKYSMVNFWLTNIDKEEAWINQWVDRGYRLKKVTVGFIRYGFEKTETKEKQEKGLYQIRMDFRPFDREADYQDYLAMFEDSGWYHVGGSKWNGLHYFEKRRESASEDIFSDHISKALRYQRIAEMYLLLMIAFLPHFIMHLQNGDLIPFTQYESWKSLYYTPGLWELSGFQFLYAFLFETPFALGRALAELSGVLIILFMLFFAYYMLKALYMGRKEKNHNKY